ncbi:MAG: AAA family ATPase [Oscillatoria sp. PMC 1068.18]|nr:AAA family ATPase [Oscillatoria sp. PMC 1068.18]
MVNQTNSLLNTNSTSFTRINQKTSVSTIGIVNQKGGCGKSTTAVHLAYWLSQQKSVILIDADSQQSSSIWVSQLKNESIPYQALLDPEALFEAIAKASQKYDTVVVDGPGSLSEVTKTILDISDLALVPCQPSGLDLSSSSKILQVIRHRQKIRQGQPQVGLFLSRGIKGTVLLKEAQVALSTDKRFPLLKTVIYQRQCVSDAPIQQATVFEMTGSAAAAAAADYEGLFKEAMKLIE